MRKLLLVLTGFLFFTGELLAQKFITGKVTDEKGMPLPNVSVVAKGTTTGTVTKEDGSFSISIRDGIKQLQLSAVGYEGQVINLQSSKTDYAVTLNSLSTDMDEVIVTGYTREKKSNFSGAATKVPSKAINQVPNGSLDQILQGRSTGLYVTAGSGQPGRAANVIIRGATSISGSTTPLYVLDGIPIQAGAFAALSSSDIESVDVLKDASATALYGSRGSNGVIVVTTKRGRANNRVVLGVNSQFGFSNRTTPKFEMMTSGQRIQYEEEIGLESGSNIGPGWTFSRKNPSNAALPEATLVSYDHILDSLRGSNISWPDIFFRQGTFQQQQVYASGGSDKVSFYSSLDYYKQQGISIRSDLERYSFRTNVDFKSDRFTAALSTTLNFSRTNSIESENTTAVSNPFSSAYYALPYEQPYINGVVVASNNDAYYNFLSTYDQREGSFALERMLSTTNKVEEIKGVLGLNLRYKIIEGLSAISTLGIDFRETMGERKIRPKTYTSTLVAGGEGSFSETVGRFIRLFGNAGLNYNKTFGSKSLVDINALFENTKATARAFNYTGFGINPLLQNSPAGITPGSAAGGFIPIVGGGRDLNDLQSLIVIGKYIFDSKYTLNGTYRYDGSSTLPKANRWQSFYSVGASWNLMRERFTESFNWLNDLQLRGSYGLTASPFAGNFTYLTTYGAARYEGLSGLGLTRIGDPNYDWEYTRATNIGLDFSVLTRRIRGSVDFYNKQTENLFIDQSLSATAGQGALSINAGTMRNRGIEVNLSGDIIATPEFLWTISGNISINRNKITSLGKVNEFPQGTSIIRVGLPYGSHFIPKWAGVDASTGNPLYYNRDGTITTTYDAANQSVAEFGSFLPKSSGGFSSSMNYKGITLEAFFSFAQGNKRFNNEDFFNETPSFATSNQNTKMLRRWRKPGDVTDIQKFGTNRIFSSKDIQDASFLRLRNVNLSYSIPSSLISKLKGISGLQFYVQAQNLATWTNWTGFDPEDNNNIATFEYPAARTITVGMNLKF